MDKMLTLLPLGGLGEIGMNGLVLNWDGHLWLIDCGIMFADPTRSSADLILPDLRFIRKRRDQFKGMILTHGHEDHIGAVPFVLKEVRMPVYASAFTHALVSRKLVEHGLVGQIDQRILDPKMSSGHEVGVRPPESPDLGFSFIRVTHSIPDAASLVIDTPVGTILHTADFKIDPEPMDGQSFDSNAFRKLGDDGVLLMLSDSTNAQVPGHTRSEREGVESLEKHVREWPGRVLITQFASNIHRLRGVAEIAKNCGRKLCLLGRSLHTYSDTAREHDVASIDASLLVRPDRLRDMDPESMIVVLTGSQGERRAALSRASVDNHPNLKIQDGDLVLWSARFIPGNERSVWQVINNLSRLGAKVIHPLSAFVHTSGHARQDELKQMLEWVRPQHFVPVHGEYAFLLEHEELARASGVENTLVIQNGQEFSVSKEEGLRVVHEHALECFYYDGSISGDERQLALKEKQKLYYNGFIAAHIQVSRQRNNPKARVSLRSRGLFTDDERLLDEAAEMFRNTLVSMPLHDSTDQEIEDLSHLLLRRFFKKGVGKKPVVVTFV
ncbi:MAG TPA: ribonuclease J, partial [Myxococcales bacterium]|nr:ribonuclease J [Myxococcales bacterium]